MSIVTNWSLPSDSEIETINCQQEQIFIEKVNVKNQFALKAACKIV